jgi:16S rRNA U1498 N3-methylase RsmE
MEDRIKDALIQEVNLSSTDAAHVASEVKQWVDEGTSRKPTKSIPTTSHLVVAGTKGGKLELVVTESTNVGVPIVKPLNKAQPHSIPFPDIDV